MGALVRQVRVANHAQARSEQFRLIQLRYDTVQESSGPDWIRIVLVKRKRLNVVVLVLGLLFWLVPGLIYLAIFATQSDEMVEIVGQFVTADRAPAEPSPELDAPRPRWDEPVIQMSPDRAQWWDGHQWLDADQVVPPTAPRSESGHEWWDGVEWRSVGVG